MNAILQGGAQPQPDQCPSLLDDLKTQRVWLLWRSVPNPEPTKKPLKVPCYASGRNRRGNLDGPEDRAQLVTYAAAVAAYDEAAPGTYAGLGIALGEDGRGQCWQGIDLDNMVATGVTDIADLWTRGACAGLGYVEASPSETGLHLIGYGRQFRSLGSNTSGIEAYAGGRFFTFTGKPIVGDSPCQPYDLADYVEQVLVPRHSTTRREQTSSVAGASVHVDPKTVTELRSALLSMEANDRGLWIAVGHALKELGGQGRGLFLEWSAISLTNFDPQDAAQKWETFAPRYTGYQAVFKMAQDRGWVNPASKAAQPVDPVASAGFHDRTPLNFLKTASAPRLSTANLPKPIADFASAYSSAHGFDVSGVIMAALASAAAMIDDAYVLEAKPAWNISARIWTVLVGRSASGKSPTIKAATAPVRNKHAELCRDYDMMCSFLDKGQERPPRQALFTSDSTVEALSDRLAANPRGMLMVTEEFASWIGQIDASTKGDAAKNRGAWLQLYDGGAYQIDRVVRGSISIPNWGASVLTATTPSALADHMRHLPEDGLIQRFIPVILAARDHDADGDASAAQKAWSEALTWIYEKLAPATVRFDPEARQLFRATEKRLGRMAEATDDTSAALASHIGKHSEMIARIALIFHVFDKPCGSKFLSASTLAKAIALMEEVRRHSLALFTDVLGSAPETDLARALARSLAADSDQEFVARDWMTQHCQAFKKAKDDRVRRAAVQLLEDLDWLQVSGTKVYAGWPTRWEVNRNISRLYAREGEMHRAQRAAVKAVFGDDGSDA